MKFSLEITVSNAEGAMERILGCLRQRGFSLCAMIADRTHDHSAIEMRVTVDGTRPADIAVKQIGKLYDVMHVRAHSMEESNGYRQLQSATQV